MLENRLLWGPVCRLCSGSHAVKLHFIWDPLTWGFASAECWLFYQVCQVSVMVDELLQVFDDYDDYIEQCYAGQ